MDLITTYLEQVSVSNLGIGVWLLPEGEFLSCLGNLEWKIESSWIRQHILGSFDRTMHNQRTITGTIEDIELAVGIDDEYEHKILINTGETITILNGVRFTSIKEYLFDDGSNSCTTANFIARDITVSEVEAHIK
jgi:hypothetical protein